MQPKGLRATQPVGFPIGLRFLSSKKMTASVIFREPNFSNRNLF